MDPLSVFRTATAAVTLAEKLAKIIERSRKEKSLPRLTEVVKSLEVSAGELCRDLTQELRRVNSELSESGIDTRKSFKALFEDLSWYNFVTHARLRKFERRFNEMYQRLAAFIDDVAVVLICSESPQLLAGPEFDSYELKGRLDKVVNSDLPVKEVLEELLRVGDSIYGKLQAT